MNFMPIILIVGGIGAGIVVIIYSGKVRSKRRR
jgi:hypothetical protein